MKKSILILLCISLMAAVLGGCAAGNANTMKATQSPVVTFTPDTATAAPAQTAAPMNTMTPDDNQTTGGLNEGMTGNAAGSMSAASSGMTPADAGKLAGRIAEAVERISEIDDAEVVVRDERALVAVEFDDQYSAGLDDRMKMQITEAVQKIEPKITEVSVTDDNTLYGQVKSLAERIGKATGFNELADDIGDLWDRVTGS